MSNRDSLLNPHSSFTAATSSSNLAMSLYSLNFATSLFLVRAGGAWLTVAFFAKRLKFFPTFFKIMAPQITITVSFQAMAYSSLIFMDARTLS